MPVERTVNLAIQGLPHGIFQIMVCPTAGGQGLLPSLPEVWQIRTQVTYSEDTLFDLEKTPASDEVLEQRQRPSFQAVATPGPAPFCSTECFV